MVFSSSIFLFHFLPFVFLIAFFIKKQYANTFLIISSIIFYAWGEPIYVLLMLFSIFINWLIGNYVQKSKILLIIGIVINLGILSFYKYAGFFITLINDLCGQSVLTVPNITLPIGISFFTFQAMSYIIDVYRKQVEPSRKLTNVALYISFFPQLIAGPIVKYKDINEQIEKRTINWSNISEGFRRFIYGLAKKVLIANILGLCVDTIYSYNISNIDPLAAWIGALTYMFQIYYDFSGYSDMAIGLGKMFGFTFLENFNYPYLSHSINEFWRRWHISLGSWFKEYVYIPLGGNKKGQLRTYINLCIVFLLTGLWHGADLSFVLWGLYHGIFSIIERLGLKNFFKKHQIIGLIYCFIIVLLGWVLFRAPNTMSGITYLHTMLMPWSYTGNIIPPYFYLTTKTITTFIFAVIGAGIIQKIASEKLKKLWINSIPEVIFCILILILSISAIANNSYNPFIYFQF